MPLKMIKLDQKQSPERTQCNYLMQIKSIIDNEVNYKKAFLITWKPIQI